VKYTDPDGRYIGIKDRVDRVGAEINNRYNQLRINNPNTIINTFILKEQVWQSIKDEVSKGLFKETAKKIARQELNKNETQIETWAENEQNRFEALLKIRDDNESTYNRIMKEAEYEYDQALKEIHFDENSRRIYDRRTIKDIADKRANDKIDELINKL
jgi:hypothetical protein